MAGNIYQWSIVAASNGTADADVPWPEGMARRQVNNSARGLMGRVAEILGDMGGALSAGGTPNGLTVTANSAFTTYENGRIVAFRATADNSGAATLSVNAIGAKSIRKMDSTGDVALAAGDIKNTGIYVAQYSAALNGAAGAWLLVNPTLSAAIYALSGLVTVDHTVPRFDGTAGKLQTSGVVIDDSNNISGIATATVSALTGGSITASSAFVGTNSGTNITLATTGAGTVLLRPNGAASSTGQTAVASTGDLTASGDVGSATNIFKGTGAAAVLATTSAGSVLLRPNGAASSAGQVSIANSGAVTINGTLTVTG